MARRKYNEDGSDFVFKLAAIVGGAYIAAEIIKAFAKKETFYSCPKCGTDIKYGEAVCHNCHVTLEWPEKDTDKKELSPAP